MEKTALDKFHDVEDALREANGGDFSGSGFVKFKDIGFFLDVKKTDTVLWYKTNWLKTNHEDEEMEIVLFGRTRKVNPLTPQE